MSTTHHSLLGTYDTPRFKYGAAVMCEVRGEVILTKLTNARIPWPLAKRPGGRRHTHAVYGALAQAVRRESLSAVAYWWGVTGQTVTKWRAAMGVGAMTEGTTLLKVASATNSPALAAARQRGVAKARDPERCEKIAASKRGKPRPRHVIEAMRKGRTGKPHTAEARRKIGEASRRRGAIPPAAGRLWTAKEEAMLGKVPDELLARKTNRKVSAVVQRRHLRRIEKYSPWD
jgi:hypothetical protein